MNLSRTYKLSFLRTRVTAAGCRERGIVGPDPKTPWHLRVGVHYFTCLLPALTPKLFICRLRFQTRLRACLTCFDCVSSIQWHAHMRHPRLWRPPRIQYRCPIFTPSRHLRQTHDSTPLPAPPSYCREPHLRMEISSPCPPLLLGPPRPSGSQGLVRPPP